MYFKILSISVFLFLILSSAFADNSPGKIITPENNPGRDTTERKIKNNILKQTDTLATIYLKDGNELTGFIISQDSISVAFRTKSGVTMNIPKNQIEKITRPKIDYVNGNYYEQDANDARLFLAPSARPIRPNSLLISDVEVFFPMIGFGVANILSVMGGISLLPYTKEQLLYINAKVTPLRLKYIDLAAGYIYMNFTSNAKGLKIGYAGATIGTNRFSVSTGLGLTFEKNSEQTPLVIIGGEASVSPGSKLILENWIFTYREAPVMTFFGARAFGPNFSGDFGFIKIWDKYTSNSSWPFFPYASATLNIDLISK